MSRWILSICLFTTAIASGGCSMCCGPYDYEYPMLDSSRYVRTDPEYGRVGSIFSDPNVSFGSVPLTNEDVPREDDPVDDLDDEGEGDPEFDADLDADASQPEFETSPTLDGGPETIDTSAQRQRVPAPRRAWR